MDPALHALNRFGLGARPGEARSLGDPRGWLRAQVKGAAPAAQPPVGAQELSDAVASFRAPSPTAPATAGQGNRQARQQARRRLVEIAATEARAALAGRVTSDRPYVERLVAFWSNHLCVSAAAKVLVAPLAGSYERDAIRPHVLGRFEDMVLASAKHPAMLAYLDNFQSIGPGSRAAWRGRRRLQRGLNENYARELLELHTLGVKGGYTQQDVLELAKVLTGWTISGLTGGSGGGSLGFVFEPMRHEPGVRTVLGRKYSDAGVEQGERAIRDFCRHPATATFVATKLVAHFVADQPPAAAVERIAALFRRTEGDLREVSNALIDLPDAWSGEARKFRTPQDWLVAVLRAFGATDPDARLINALRQLRHPLWSPQAPKGFGDTTQEWADPDSLLNRAELARTLVRRMAREPGDVIDVVDVPEADPLRAVVSDRSIPVVDRLALAIAGPVFQWR
jgi:uncharacterized protein (DUF1800 family)